MESGGIVVGWEDSELAEEWVMSGTVTSDEERISSERQG